MELEVYLAIMLITAPFFFIVGFTFGYHYKEYLQKHVPARFSKLLH